MPKGIWWPEGRLMAGRELDAEGKLVTGKVYMLLRMYICY